MFLLDTNIVIYVLLGEPARLRERVLSVPAGQLLTSSVVFAEAALGLVRQGADTEPLRTLQRRMSVRPFDEAAAMAYARLPFRRRSFDRLIAAHALSLDAVLVTNNPLDFADVAGLHVENWTA